MNRRWANILDEAWDEVMKDPPKRLNIVVADSAEDKKARKSSIGAAPSHRYSITPLVQSALIHLVEELMSQVPSRIRKVNVHSSALCCYLELYSSPSSISPSARKPANGRVVTSRHLMTLKSNSTAYCICIRWYGHHAVRVPPETRFNERDMQTCSLELV
jgi:hypothetical protein